MELPFFTAPTISLRVSTQFHIFSQNFCFKTRKNRPLSAPNSFKCFPCHPPFSTSSRFNLYAHFRRPARRQNYLRKKLAQQHQKVSKESTIYNPTLNNVSESSSSSLDDVSGPVNSVNELEAKKGLPGDSVLWNKLESWVEQYKADIDLWGAGIVPIFTVFQDSEGKVVRVEVNEDEICRRSGVKSFVLYEDAESEVVVDVNSKVTYAKELARELEKGNPVLPRNSSVVKFVRSSENLDTVNVVTQGLRSSFTNVIQGINRVPGLFPKMSIGVLVLAGVAVVWSVRRSLTVGEDRQEYTMLEKEMLRRKLKVRSEREKIVNGNVEVHLESVEPECVSIQRPGIDREELIKDIISTKGISGKLAVESLGHTKTENEQFSNKIQEIRAMARRVREIEKQDTPLGNGEEEDNQTGCVFLNLTDVNINPKVKFPDERRGHVSDDNVNTSETYSDDLIKSSFTAPLKALDGTSLTQGSIIDISVSNQKVLTPKASKVDPKLDRQAPNPSRSHVKTRVRVIRSVSEAREYLSRKHENHDLDQVPRARNSELDDTFTTAPSERKIVENTSQKIEVFDAVTSSAAPNLTDTLEAITHKEKEFILTNRCNPESEVACGDRKSGRENHTDGNLSAKENNMNKKLSTCVSGRISDFNSKEIACEDFKLLKNSSPPEEAIQCENVEEGKEINGHLIPGSNSAGDRKTSESAELEPSGRAENWIEKNFHELEPIIKKMGVAFTENYLTAKDKKNQDLNSKPVMIQFDSNDDDGELAWMKDEKLRDIVFKVRDNELAGRGPFHLMDDEDKLAFFSGLEKKVEQENKKLVNLHVWLHSNIENLDYGADGISLYDPPEKVIPRWKGPPVDDIPKFLNNSRDQRKESLADSDVMKPMVQDSLQKESPSVPSSSLAPDFHSKVQDKISKSSKTMIQGSDGSTRSGKKSGKEFWQHTKKWSQGFLDCYNAETDPEVKGVMKDMGKDLDRWITEKEIQEAAQLMDRLPESGKEFIKEKLDKVRREVELFGPQAVVSKYREYGDEEEEDFLWWLDLAYVLCIEVYTEEEGEQRVGLYSLEMAPDLELSPKPCHVIAFEDAGDCKSLCYIIQHHMEMLGNGNAFVIARPPKDAFREAKANGFSVTVIRKGELQLNVDQTLEEVEELITEIGSKIYHDKIMKERSADIRSLMKGVFGLSHPSKRRRRSKRKLKKPTKP